MNAQYMQACCDHIHTCCDSSVKKLESILNQCTPEVQVVIKECIALCKDCCHECEKVKQ